MNRLSNVNVSSDEFVSSLNLENLDIDDERIRDNLFTWMSMIKRLAYNFDKVVNPYINDEIALDDALNYVYKVDVVKNTDALSNELHIIDRETGNGVSYYKYNNTISYELKYCCLDGDIMTVRHIITVYHEFGKKITDEQLMLTYNNDKRNTSVRLNLTNGQVFLGNLETKLSNKLLKLVYEEMLNAISFASNVTINNMKRKKVARVLKK